MSETQEATVNPDGSTTFSGNSTEEDFINAEAEDILEATSKIDPAVYLLGAVIVVAIISFLIYRKRKKDSDSIENEFFTQLDGGKFDLKLPVAVEEYYTLKEKVIEAGWTPGQKKESQTGPHRVLAQALMKRCIADIPLVTHIQKESSGMNKLYSHSMCSVAQWKAYQVAEAMVSAEVDEVREEADEIEPGWSEVIWRQAMQYHNMLKQRHDMEQKAAQEAAQRKKLELDKEEQKRRLVEEKKAKELAAEKAAQELIRAEEREKQSKTAFSNGGMKKGFLGGSSKKKS